jgi:hypothetical protein
LRGAFRDSQARANSRKDVDVVLHRRPAHLIGLALEVGAPRHAVGDVGLRIGVVVAVHAGDPDPPLREHLVEEPLVLEWKRGRRIEPVAADVQRQQLAVPLKVDPPGRAPAGLPLDPHHPPAEIALQPFGDGGELGHVAA